MSGLARRFGTAVCLLVLCTGTFAGGALAAVCAPAPACPMAGGPIVAGPMSSHCAPEVALTANCCASMGQTTDLAELPRSTSTSVVAVSRATSVTGAICLEDSLAPCIRRGSTSPPVPLYTLFSSLLT